MELVVLAVLILANGVFAMSEMALVTARESRMQRLLDEGDRAALAAAKLRTDPTRFLSAIQIGITSIGVLNGIVGEAALAGPIAESLASFGLPIAYAGVTATALVVIAITYLSIVLGELVPKRLGQSNPEAVARFVARPVDWLAAAAKPFVWLLTRSTETLLGLLGVRGNDNAPVTEEEIHALLAEGTSAGVIESHEHAMVRNVFRLDDRQISSLMVPRSDMIVLDADAGIDDILNMVEASDHARFPVVRGRLDDVLGVLNARRFLARVARGERPELAKNLDAPVYVPETLAGMELLSNFRANGAQMAFVVDEYSEVLGIVTLQDLIEAITGEFQPRDPHEAWAVRRDDGSWLLDGLIPLPELKDRLGLVDVPEEELGRYHTLSGMLMLLTGRLPHEGDRVGWEGWRFEIVDMDGRRVDKVLATKLDEAQPL